MEDSYEEPEFNGDESEELFRGPNDGAYEKQELRTGPPLDYVAEKIRRSLEVTHRILNELNGIDVSKEQKDSLFSHAQGAFRYQLTGYLALKNMLAVVNNDGLFQRTEHFSYNDFLDWLDGIDQQGSVEG